MTRQPIFTEKAPAAIGPYSQAVVAEGRFVFCSGQIPLTPAGELKMASIEEQTTQCMENIKALLRSQGVALGQIVKTTIYLSSMDHFATVNEVYGKYFQTGAPARSTVAVAGLPKGVDVEIEAIAVA